MAASMTIGVGQSQEGREATRQALQSALERKGKEKPVLAIVFISQEFDVEQTIATFQSLVGDLPIWGFTTLSPLSSDGDLQRSVAVMILWGNDLNVQTQWLPNLQQDRSGGTRQLVLSLLDNKSNGQLVVLDGMNTLPLKVLASVAAMKSPLAGCQASGDFHRGKTVQIGGNQWGSGGMSIASFGDGLAFGVGMAHGWVDTGVSFQITKVRGGWVAGLDNLPASEAYGRVFGYPARDWSFSPLRELIRLYPLGVEGRQGNAEIELRSPLHVEVDGSLRMNAPVDEGRTAHLMIGDTQACLRACREACKIALAQLGSARPIGGLVFVDPAWKYLFENKSRLFMKAIAEQMGDLPLAGAYTFGQIGPGREGNIHTNQQILVAVFGAPI
jgi:hypothetical protein